MAGWNPVLPGGKKASEARPPTGTRSNSDTPRPDRSRRAGGTPPPRDDEEWLTTFLDTITLILTFLVVLIARANFEDPGTTGTLNEAIAAALIPPLAAGQPADNALADSLRLAAASAGLPGSVTIDPQTGEVRLNLFDDLAFAPGSAELTSAAAELVGHIAMLMFNVDTLISVEGHTDSLPIANVRFPSNWHLSAARAGTVVSTLSTSGVRPERLRAIGYGETRPLAENETAEGRAQNRRVTITFHNGVRF